MHRDSFNANNLSITVPLVSLTYLMIKETGSLQDISKVESSETLNILDAILSD